MTKQQSARVWVAISPRGKIEVETVSPWRGGVKDLAAVYFGLWENLKAKGWRIKRARVVVEG